MVYILCRILSRTYDWSISAICHILFPGGPHIEYTTCNTSLCCIVNSQCEQQPADKQLSRPLSWHEFVVGSLRNPDTRPKVGWTPLFGGRCCWWLWAWVVVEVGSGGEVAVCRRLSVCSEPCSCRLYLHTWFPTAPPLTRYPSPLSPPPSPTPSSLPRLPLSHAQLTSTMSSNATHHSLLLLLAVQT